jgi:hypothetical protein
VAQLAERTRLELPDTLARDPELDPNLLQRPTVGAVEAEAEDQDTLESAGDESMNKNRATPSFS